jgi:hypothetical protein
MDEPEEVFKYTFKYEDGSYYCYKGDCARSHRCGYLQDATLYNNPDDLKFWAAETGDVVVKVRITYEEVAYDPGRSEGEATKQHQSGEE